MASRGRRIGVGVGVAVVVVAAIGGFLLWRVFGGSAPPPVSLSSLDLPSVAASSGGSPASLDGTWTINTSTTLSDGSGTFAGYRIDEQLANVGANTAVGRTSQVSGSMTIDGTKITALNVSVDMTGLESDDSRRDNQLRERGLETDRFPTATFELTKPIDVGSTPKQGQQVRLEATGTFTLHGVTKPVTVPITAVWSGDLVAATASFDVALADYGIDPPTGFFVLSIADSGTVEMRLLFTQG
ncbi:MAG TPA: YceI family protein [Actinomycetota bacterium]|nr:YceI family protein [Actinomycetota bacterium]